MVLIVSISNYPLINGLRTDNMEPYFTLFVVKSFIGTEALHPIPMELYFRLFRGVIVAIVVAFTVNIIALPTVSCTPRTLLTTISVRSKLTLPKCIKALVESIFKDFLANLTG